MQGNALREIDEPINVIEMNLGISLTHKSSEPIVDIDRELYALLLNLAFPCAGPAPTVVRQTQAA